jgi:type IV pilus assembly protein PilP
MMQLSRTYKFIFLLTAIFAIIGLQGMDVFAAEEKVVEEQKELKFTEKMAAILFQDSGDTFVYKREGRTDPFVSFIQEKVLAVKTPVEELTGMRKFEPGQLTVVAIILGAADKFAMVQDSNNQGYIIREGLLLGRTGVVEAVVPNKVIVKNYTYNLAGDKIYKTVEMVLNQEGEK